MIAEPSGRECPAADGHCITCSDEGIPMRVVSADDVVALCCDETHGDEMHELHEVAIDLVTPVRAGERVLVHAGVAIGHLESIPARPTPDHP